MLLLCGVSRYAWNEAAHQFPMSSVNVKLCWCLPIRSKLSRCSHTVKLFVLIMSLFRDKERIYLSKRKGFVKVAMQAGADIVPVYILGQSQVIM